MRRSESFLNSKIKELKKMFLSMKPKRGNHKSFVLQKVQPALLRLMDSAVSTLAPIFAVAGLTGKPEDAFFVGLAASLGADVSMGPAEALSDDGTVTDRGSTIYTWRHYRDRNGDRWDASHLSLFNFEYKRSFTNAFSKKLENLQAAVALHFAHYNLVRVHKTLRVTPAMATNVTDRLWSLEELVEQTSK